MNLRRRLPPYSLALALLLGHWLSFAHGFQHDVFAPEPTCQVCVHGQALDSALPVLAATAVNIRAAGEAPRIAPSGPVRAAGTVFYRSRAPPTVLA